MARRLVCCDIFYREACHLVAQSPHRIDIDFLPKGLHDIGAGPMRDGLQERIDAVPAGMYEAVLLGYGLCNNGLDGLTARDAPLIVPRAHDCITMFLGSRERYRRYFDEHPGVYFHTSGWIERAAPTEEFRSLSVGHRLGMDQSYEDLVAKYGADNAEYLREVFGGGLKHYGQFTFIAMGVGPEAEFERVSRERATQRNWAFERIEGDLSLMRRLLDGPWDGDFVRVEPGGRIKAVYDDRVMEAVPPETPAAPPAPARAERSTELS